MKTKILIIAILLAMGGGLTGCFRNQLPDVDPPIGGKIDPPEGFPNGDINPVLESKPSDPGTNPSIPPKVACEDNTCIGEPNPDWAKEEPPQKNTGVKGFQNCEELKAFLDEKSRREDSFDLAGDVAGSPVGERNEASAAEPSGAREDASKAPVVEEADIVKQEGDRLYVVTSDSSSAPTLFIYDVSIAETPSRIGQAELGLRPLEIYVQDGKVVVIGSPRYDGVETMVQVLDVSDPSLSKVLRSYALNGYYLDSRKVGSSIYLANRSWELGLWEKSDPSLCTSVYAPEKLGAYSSSITHVFGINLDRLDEEPQRISLIGSGESTVYSSPEHFYVTDLFWQSDWTSVYLFDLDKKEARPVLRSAATVPGRIVNQFSMDEHKGYFRIATTTNRNTFGAADNRNYLTVFKTNQSSLRVSSQIDSITPGESITAARFLGDKAYITTYVTKDPLLVVDLHPDKKPEILGELEVPGYSSYLQAWGEDRVLSIGSTQEFWGQVILSLFDVSDLRAPRLIEQITLEDSWGSEAQQEHKAFSFFENLGILAIPVDSFQGSKLSFFSVDPAKGFTLLGDVNHRDLVSGDYYPVMRRALKIDGILYTLSEAGLKIFSLDPLSQLFGEMFPGFKTPDFGSCGCRGEFCTMMYCIPVVGDGIVSD